jgi:hypothetical protein
VYLERGSHPETRNDDSVLLRIGSFSICTTLSHALCYSSSQYESVSWGRDGDDVNDDGRG